MPDFPLIETTVRTPDNYIVLGLPLDQDFAQAVELATKVAEEAGFLHEGIKRVEIVCEIKEASEHG